MIVWLKIIPIFLIGLLAGYLLKSNSSKTDSEIVATYKGGKVSVNEMLKNNQSQIYDQEKILYYTKKEVVEGILKEKFLGHEGTYLNLEEVKIEDSKFEEYLNKLGLSLRKLTPSENQLHFDNLRRQVALQKQKQNFSKKASELLLKYHLPLPTYPLVQLKDSGLIKLGTSNAKKRITLFFNHGHPNWYQLFDVLEEINHLLIVPVEVEVRFLGSEEISESLKVSFISSICFFKQGKFKEFQNLIKDSLEVTTEDFSEFKKKNLINQENLEKCLNDPKILQTLSKDTEDLGDFKSLNFPIFVIGKKVVPASEDLTIIKDIIEREF